MPPAHGLPGRVARALKRLAEQPRYSRDQGEAAWRTNGRHMVNLVPHRPLAVDGILDHWVAEADEHERTDHLRKEVVPVKELLTCQHSVRVSNVRRIIRNFERAVTKQVKFRGLEIPEINVVHFMGRHVIRDGNHRINAAILLGVSKLHITVLDTGIHDNRALLEYLQMAS